MHEMGRKLLFIGDSLIEFNDWSARFPRYDVVNLGIAGESVDGLLRRIGSIISSVKNPDYVFIMSGINNLAMGDAGFADTYRLIVRRLKEANPGAGIYVHSLLPVDFPWISNDNIREMNSILRDMAAEEGVFYVDAFARFTDDRGEPQRLYLLDDGVHLSEDGYRAWGLLVEEIISAGK